MYFSLFNKGTTFRKKRIKSNKIFYLGTFKIIQDKLHDFIKKYYYNEIIKGSILFLSFGLLYFIFTLIIEYFLWLKPLARTILFWVFVVVEIALLVKFIVIPILKLFHLRKGISLVEASKIIGAHFHEVDDKLVNVLQLSENISSSDLLLASIEQKAEKLEPVPFKNAINFKSNKKFVKYLAIPFLIWILIFISGNGNLFTQSFDRVVHHKIAYSPPAPFNFIVLNKSLQAIEGKPFVLKVGTEGDLIPEDVKIFFKEESYYLKNEAPGRFGFNFDNPQQSITFYLEANGFESVEYVMKVVSIPKIVDFEMVLDYPTYTKRKLESIKNTGNAVVPDGTIVTWNVTSKNASNISFDFPEEKFSGQKVSKDFFKIERAIRTNLDYTVSTSNDKLSNYENLKYRIDVIPDEYPKIIVKSDIDSVSRGPVQFVGQISDDYGLSRLQVTAKNVESNELVLHNLPISKSDFEEFFYVFPNGLILEVGKGYEIYFEVFDNDGIHGSKKVKSESFFYKNKTDSEINEELLLEQKESLERMDNSAQSAKEMQKAIERLSDKLKRKDDQNWNDKKELDKFLQRQKQYKEILKKNTDKLFDNLEEMDDESSPEMQEKNDDLKSRIEETKELLKKEDLLRQLQELTDKLQKEDLLQNVEKLKQQTKQETRSLERILELTKRFYVEKKFNQIHKELDELSKEQNELSESEDNKSENQKKLNKKFDSIQKDLNDLQKDNKGLKQPMDIPSTKTDEEKIDSVMKQAEQELMKEVMSDSEKSEKNFKAKKNQKSAAKKMKELSEKMKSGMQQMEMEMLDENIDDLKQILDNLILFSFQQEEVMISLDDKNSKNADYPGKLKKQQILKEYFEHIDDSLYTLSLRMVKLSSKIQTEIADAHYNLEMSLENIAENNMKKGISNQQYTMTAANNLADLLSDILESLQNKKPGNGKGSGKDGEEISLPDIIKKQSELLQKAKEGMKPGEGESGKSREQMSGEQFEIFKQQSELRQQLNDLLNGELNSSNEGKRLSNQMEQLEKLLLEKGITNEVLDRMQKLEYELLQLENASSDQKKDNKRNSNSNRNNYESRFIEALTPKKIFFNQNEILERQNLPLNSFYKAKVKLYFEQF